MATRPMADGSGWIRPPIKAEGSIRIDLNQAPEELRQKFTTIPSDAIHSLVDINLPRVIMDEAQIEWGMDGFYLTVNFTTYDDVEIKESGSGS
jgi:hypothetical protein